MLRLVMFLSLLLALAGGATATPDDARAFAYVCSDGLDNDGDGLKDFGPAIGWNDPGCSFPGDATEENGSSACYDGADNDYDGQVDYPNDPGCSSYSDTDETNAAAPPPTSNGYACGNLVDDDGDGKIDYPNDPGCYSLWDTDEGNVAQCADGVDNDADGKIDTGGVGYPPAPADDGCSSPWDDTEFMEYVPPAPPPADDFQWETWAGWYDACTEAQPCMSGNPANRCAVKPNRPSFRSDGVMTAKFENQCRFIPLKLNNVACLIRYPDVADPQAWQGQMLQCWSNQKFGSPYLALNFTYLCDYTTVYYKFKISGYGYVTTVGGRSYTSPSVESTYLRAVCS